MQKLGATPAKLALVGVLGIVFLFVVVPQLTGSNSEPLSPQVSPKKRTTRNRPRRENQTTAQSSAKEAKETLPELHWPLISLEEIVKNDPMKVPKLVRKGITRAEEGTTTRRHK